MPSKSTYAQQLIAKQKIKNQYGKITETQFKLVYKEALRARGDTVENMIGLLESRLDNAVYRMKLAPTIHAARQLVSHVVHVAGFVLREVQNRYCIRANLFFK